MKSAFNLHQFAEIIRTLFSRLYGGNGAKFYSGSVSASGERFYTIYIAEEATFTSVTGGGGNASTWIDTIPAGTTLTAPVGSPVTAFTISAGKVVGY